MLGHVVLNLAWRGHPVGAQALIGTSWRHGFFGVDDGLVLRELRRQLKLGVPAVYEVMKDDPLMTADGDAYAPTIEIAHFSGKGQRSRVLETLEPYREIDAGSVPISQVKMARLPIQPHDHYGDIDVIAEMTLLGDDYRKGYHN